MQHTPSPRQRGFSLLEVLITLVVLAGGLLAIGGLYGKIMNGSAAAKERSEAVVLAEQKLEELRHTLYASIPAGDHEDTDPIAGTAASYTRSWTVTPSASPAYKTVTVTVSWTDSRNQSQSAVLASRISGIDPARSAALIASVSTSNAGPTGSTTGGSTDGTTGEATGGTTDGSSDDSGGETPGGDSTPTTCTTKIAIKAKNGNSTVTVSPSATSSSNNGVNWTFNFTSAKGTSLTFTDSNVSQPYTGLTTDCGTTQSHDF